MIHVLLTLHVSPHLPVRQLKRMKQIEQERDTLSQGLQMVDRARDWYTRQLAAVSERMKYLGLGRAHQQSVSQISVA